MRNKFVYSCNVKIHSLGSTNSQESICHIKFGYGSIFPTKSCRDAWRSGSWLVRGQVNMADEAKLRSPSHSTFEALIVWREVWHCHGEELGPLCWPVPAAGIAVFGASHWFAEHASQMWWFCWNSESCNVSNGQQTTKQCLWPFGASLALGSALEFLVQPLSWS